MRFVVACRDQLEPPGSGNKVASNAARIGQTAVSASAAKGDFTAAERHDREIKALEARAGSVLAPTVAPAAPYRHLPNFSRHRQSTCRAPAEQFKRLHAPTLALGSTLPAAPPSSPASPAAKPNVAAPPKQSPPPTKSVSPPSILPPPPPLTRLHPHRP